MKIYAAAPLAALVVASAGSVAGASSVVTYNDTLSTPFYPGSGNTNTNFVINTITESGGNVVELGIKAKKRQGADSATPSYGDGKYAVQPGLQAGNPDRWWWNFDYSMNLGDRTLQDTTLTLRIDFDNDAASAISVPLNFLIAGGDGSQANVPSGLNLYQNSKNLSFGEFALPGGDFDPYAVGTYTISIEAMDATTNTVLGTVSMQAVVVPLPGAAGLALAGLGLIGSRRRR